MGRLRFADAPGLRPVSLLAAAAALLSVALVGATPARSQVASAPLKIGIIGTGRIGGTLARLWVRAGHEVFVSSRHPEELQALVTELGPRAHAGTPREAASFGTVILVSIPYSAMPQIGQDLGAALAGKVILDTSNPIASRDGAMAFDAQQKGAGVATAAFLHSNRVVRAFNCIPAASLARDGNRQPERLAIPIGGDDAKALEIAQGLVRDAGFEPVLVGSLARTRDFDLGQPLALSQLTAAEYRSKLGK